MEVLKSRRTQFALGIFVFALLLRLIGIGWGLKNDFHSQSYHPDEPVVFHYSQAIEPAQLKFSPGFYNYGTLYLSVLRVASDMTAAYTGAPDPKSDDSFWSFVSRVDLAGRILSALAGAGTALLLFLIGARLFGNFGGFAAGMLIAVAPAHVIHSRFQTVDILATFFLAASALLALKMLADHPKMWKLAIWAGVFAGLSAGTKYTGILALSSVVICAFYARRDSEDRSFKNSAIGLSVIAIASALLTFLITTPGAIMDNAKFLEDFKYEMAHTAAGHGLVFAHTSSGFIYHWANLSAGIGPLLALIGVGGLFFAAFKKHPWAFATIALFVLYYLLIGRAEVKFLRYTFPLYIGIAVGFGYAMSLTRTETNRKRFGIVMLILLLGGVDQGGLVGAAKATTWMAMADPRDQAAAYLKEESKSIPGATAGYAKDPWTWSVPYFKDATIPRLPMGPGYLAGLQEFRNPFFARMGMMSPSKDPHGEFFYEPIPAELGGTGGGPPQYHDFDVRLITEIKPTFVTFTSLEADAVERLSSVKGLEGEEKAAVSQYNEFVAALQKDYTLVKDFGSPAPSVEDIQYVQPRVFVWKRKA